MAERSEDIEYSDLLALNEWAERTNMRDDDKRVIAYAMRQSNLQPKTQKEVGIFAVGFFCAVSQIIDNNEIEEVKLLANYENTDQGKGEH